MVPHPARCPATRHTQGCTGGAKTCPRCAWEPLGRSVSWTHYSRRPPRAVARQIGRGVSSSEWFGQGEPGAEGTRPEGTPRGQGPAPVAGVPRRCPSAGGVDRWCRPSSSSWSLGFVAGDHGFAVDRGAVVRLGGLPGRLRHRADHQGRAVRRRLRADGGAGRLEPGHRLPHPADLRAGDPAAAEPRPVPRGDRAVAQDRHVRHPAASSACSPAPARPASGRRSCCGATVSRSAARTRSSTSTCRSSSSPCRGSSSSLGFLTMVLVMALARGGLHALRLRRAADPGPGRAHLTGGPHPSRRSWSRRWSWSGRRPTGSTATRWRPRTRPLLTGIRYTDAHAVLPAKAILAVAALMTRRAVHRLHLDPLLAAAGRRRRAAAHHLDRRRQHLPGALPAVHGQAVGEVPRAGLHRPQHQGDPRGLRHRGRRRPGYTATTEASQGQLRDDAETIPGIRLVDPIVVSPTFKQLQSVKSYYAFPDALDVDRYNIDGKVRDTVVAVRELDLERPAGQPAQLAQRPHRLHARLRRGGGLRQPAHRRRRSRSSTSGTSPRRASCGDFEPRIYFGEQSPAYSIVGRRQGRRPARVRLPGQQRGRPEEHHLRRQGRRRRSGSLPRKLAYALKYRELNLLLSDAVNDKSRILDHREPLERVERVAPWLTPRRQPLPGGRRRPGPVDHRRLHHDGRLPLLAADRDRQRDLGLGHRTLAARSRPSAAARSTTSATRSRRPSTPTTAR